MKRDHKRDDHEKGFRERLVIDLWRFVKASRVAEGESAEVVLARHRLLVDEVLFLAETLPNPAIYSPEMVRDRTCAALSRCQSESLCAVPLEEILGILEVGLAREE